MNRIIGKLVALAIFGSVATWATTIYSNTTTDTLNTIFYSVGPYSELGDQIHLAGTDRMATMATVQFFNNGANASATFDATLRFYQVGSPVGTQIGSDFVMTGIAAPAGGVFNVSFSLLNLVVPDDLIFTVSLSNVSGGTDLGLDMFEPPTIGSSNNTFMIDKQGMSFAQLSTPMQNVYFQLDAFSVPEPGTLLLLGAGLSGLGFLGFRRRRQWSKS